MSEPNPYEPPRKPELFTRVPKVNPWLNCWMILLLIPPATRVALFVGESVLLLLAYAAQAFPSTVVMSLVVLGPPLTTVVAMLWWALRAYQRDRRKRDACPT